MISPDDLITLPYTSDLTQAGIVYACRSLPHTYNRMGGSLENRLRRIVLGKAVELAFRRYLTSQEVPFDTLGATPFTDPDQYDVSLGGHRCDIKSYGLFDREKIRQVRRDPASLLEASALVPTDQLVSDHLNDDDLYVFAFITALIAGTHGEFDRAQTAGQPAYLIYPFPTAWSQPAQWASLGKLVLKSELDETLAVELGGQGSARYFQTESLSLPPHTRTGARNDYYSLSYMNTLHIPPGRIGVHSPRLRKTCIINPNDWGNIWVYGMEIFLVGYMRRGEFRRKASDLPANSRVMQYRRTRTHNQAIPVRQLYPLEHLFERVIEWEEKGKGTRDKG